MANDLANDATSAWWQLQSSNGKNNLKEAREITGIKPVFAAWKV